MRPLLAPYEDQDVWGVDYKDNKIYSLNQNLASTLDPVQIAMGVGNGQQINMNAFIREKELRRRYQDAMQTQNFHFDNVFGIETKTPQIYHVIARPITKAALQGYNGTVFMYGQTTSGKTYTMLGTQEIPGILPCAVRDVFNGVKNDSQNNNYNVWVSYMEIYNESINDLLSPGKTNLKIKDDPNHGVDVALLKKQQVFSFDQAIILMNYGEEHRIYKETSIHEHSSRSHTIFRIYIESCPVNKSGPKRYSMLNLVDLAGSERLNDFEQKSDTLGETGYINKSLFVLSNVINKLAEGKSGHIPYRDSKLTRILQMALGGNSLTAIICTISPAAINYYQSLSTLRFATRAKTVKNKPTVNEIVDEQELATQMFKKEIEHLKEQIVLKDSELVKFQEFHLKLQQNLNQEKEQKDQLNREMNDIKSRNQQTSTQQEQFNFMIEQLKQQLKQAQEDKENLQAQNDDLKIAIETINQNDNQSLGRFVESIQEQCESYIIEQANTPNFEDYFSQFPQEKLILQSNMFWISEVDKLKSQFKLDALAIQNQYRLKFKEIIEQIYNEDNEQFASEGMVQTVLKIVDIEQREKASQFANAEKVLHDIDRGIVFDDIMIEYEQVYAKSLELLGYNYKDLEQGLIVPAANDLNKIIDDLKEYYSELIQVVQKRYDEVKIILETYFRQMIAIKREELDSKHQNDEITEEDFQQQANTFAQIADNHNMKLTRLREGFEDFSKHIDERFDEQIDRINQLFNEVDFDLQESFQSSQQNDDQMDQEIQQNYYSKQSQNANMNSLQTRKTSQQNQQKIINTYGSQQMMSERDMNQFQMSIQSIQEEPPEVRASINHHQMVTPTPKFSNANKFRNNSQTQGLLNKENSDFLKSAQSFKEQLLPRNKLNSQGISAYQSGQPSSQNISNCKIYVWGSGKDGRCGNGKESSEKLPNQINSQYKFSQLSCGYHHSAGVTSDGMILSWGRGIFGQLGHGDTENYSLPTPIETLVKIQIIQVACGWQHTMSLSSQGRVFSWGYGEDGQLGHGDTNDYLLPKELDYFKKNQLRVSFIACGHSHSGCITDSSSAQLYMWGCNPDSRLMIDDNENQLLPTQTILESAKQNFLNKGDHIKAEGLEPCSLSLGVTHSAVITRSGDLFTAGSKLDGQLGIRYEISDFQSSAPSMSNTQQSFTESSFINQFKDNKDVKSQSAPINKVSAFGYQNKAVMVSCGDAFTIVLNEGNQIYAFGKLSHGRLGLGSLPKHSLKSGGLNPDNSQSEGVDHVSEPTIIHTLINEKVLQISAGCRHAACITDQGKLYVWGFNFYEQLGLGDSEKDFDIPTRVIKNLQQNKVKFVSCGYFHTGALVQTNQ
ncbi:kinesin motor domain containing protein [Stylonychia lemnae]|uniref:Kinesin motor domain containing protein n=1 Tax=Stylonychia lemnae TaxID=5949 RepID=A0A078AYN2_STYLE|nr:kinesin motor domain containing protein [Stylonychia lemnae]|eukprot:CDW87540.1 kinesin motor domain containing protein [Stylonychia lemnae]